MVFSGIVFLYYFLPAVLLAYFLCPKRSRNTVLLVSSLVFYAWGEPKYVFLMIFTIVIGFLSGIMIEKSESQKQKKLWMIASIVINLLILVFFKYTDFIISTVNGITKSNIPLLKIALPIGISFYTFQTLSYSIDVYRGNAKVQKNIINFGAYVTMFPQLVAGPIVRYADIAQRLDERKENFKDVLDGIGIITAGLAKKVLIANNIGMLWETISSTPSISVSNAWLGVIAYTLQIYFDFSGYSDMAIGLGKLFGFDFLKNFDSPYISKSITEFWRRWHMSLGSWFREYVYIPLGGNRVKLSRSIFNLFVVWGLTGLWHGAAMNFIIWGLYYGMILVLEKYVLKNILKKTPTALKFIYTMLLVMIGWVFFASPDIMSAFGYLGKMMGLTDSFVDLAFIYNLKSYAIIIVLGILFSTPLPKLISAKILKKDKYGIIFIVTIIITLFVCTAYLVDSTYNPFLYFRF